jgi:hypothetical protein
MGSAKQFACRIHYLQDNERFGIARCLECAASLLVKLDRLITGSILRSKLVFLIMSSRMQFWDFGLEAVCGYILPSVWTLIMRAIKCLKGVRWMPWR